MKKIILSFISAMLITASGAAFWMVRGLSDFDLAEHNTREVSFTLEDALLSGTLVMPRDSISPPIALIVHGDGPQDRFSGGGYLPLINTLVDAGIGVFSWDKAGVEKSTGNWLNQTMDDRADEVLTAFQAIAAQADIEIDQIGFLGFSQAGWVLPRVANRIVPAFTVIVGGAVSWREQGIYYNRIRMEAEGIDLVLIEQRLADRSLRNDALFEATATPKTNTGMTPERFRFVAGAYWENSSGMISNMKGPVLAIWGDNDLNVDAHSDSVIFQEQLKLPTGDKHVILVPNATHGLLRTNWFNFQILPDWPWYLEYVFLGMGRDAYAPQSLVQIINWIKKKPEH
jgi:pimeloyl-ACP methyl ester carboxylesterase